MCPIAATATVTDVPAAGAGVIPNNQSMILEYATETFCTQEKLPYCKRYEALKGFEPKLLSFSKRFSKNILKSISRRYILLEVRPPP
jgi:hypothetical protein